MSVNVTFDPTCFGRKRMKDLFIAQCAKPPDFVEINLSRLTAFQRMLLVTDGGMTRLIEAMTLSPVEVIVLSQERQTLSERHDWLEAHEGTTVIDRRVILRTQRKGGKKPILHLHAVSLVVPDRLPEAIREGLETVGEGLGRLLDQSGLETRRDLLWCGVERPKTLPQAINHLEGSPFLARTYRIVSKGVPIMLINERFPLDSSPDKKSTDEPSNARK